MSRTSSKLNVDGYKKKKDINEVIHIIACVVGSVRKSHSCIPSYLWLMKYTIDEKAKGKLTKANNTRQARSPMICCISRGYNKEV